MLLSLSNTPRDYAWGSRTLIAELEGRPPASAPEAEVWFGDHPGDPADVENGSTLDAVTGGKLPYLLKLLAAADPLSIQVHPTIQQAQDGWAREASLAPADPTRNYRDANHKPELIVALSDRFEALGGLRPVDEAISVLRSFPQGQGISALIDKLSAGGDVMRESIAWLLSGDASDTVAEIEAALESADRSAESENIAAIRAVAQRNPGDPGIVVALLMNYIVLARGEAIFLRAGLLHAYLAGLGVEIMAASDNVLRGGLTPKHVDVAELLAILDTTPAAVPVLRPWATGAVVEYPVDIDDFSLRRINVDGAPVEVSVSGPAIALSTGGLITVSGVDALPRAIGVGKAIFASEDERTLVFAGNGEVFLATPGRGHDTPGSDTP